MKRYRHVFFDLDRTLWDFDSAAEVAFGKIFDKYELGKLGIPSAHGFHEVYSPLNEKLWELYRADRITKEELNRTRFLSPLQHYGIDDVTLADNLSRDYVYWSPRIVRLMPGTFELLDYLKPNYHLHIITNGFVEIQNIKLACSHLDAYFETLTVSEEAGVKKPNPAIFEFALSKASAHSSESLMIGDEIDVDIVGAAAAGMDTVFFNYLCRQLRNVATFEIDNLLELKNIL